MSFTTLVSSSLPEGMRGALNKWFIEVLPGVFVGTMSRRIRDEIWEVLARWIQDETSQTAYAALIESAPTEQGFTVRTSGWSGYEVVDMDGLQLIARHHKEAPAGNLQDLPDPTW